MRTSLPWVVGLLISNLLAVIPATSAFAEDEFLDDSVESSDQPIALELAQGIELLNEQITQQEQLLGSAQTDREQQLIRNHIRSLQKERRSLQNLLHKLVGPNVDVLEAAREQQSEQRSERYEKTLEREDRTQEP